MRVARPDELEPDSSFINKVATLHTRASSLNTDHSGWTLPMGPATSYAESGDEWDPRVDDYTQANGRLYPNHDLFGPTW